MASPARCFDAAARAHTRKKVRCRRPQLVAEADNSPDWPRCLLLLSPLDQHSSPLPHSRLLRGSPFGWWGPLFRRRARQLYLPLARHRPPSWCWCWCWLAARHQPELKRQLCLFCVLAMLFLLLLLLFSLLPVVLLLVFCLCSSSPVCRPLRLLDCCALVILRACPCKWRVLLRVGIFEYSNMRRRSILELFN